MFDLGMKVCMYVCICICVCIYLYMCMKVCMYMYICMYVFVYMYGSMYICMYVSTYALCICTYIYVCHCKQNRTQSLCLNQWISKQLHVLSLLSTTYVTALKCRLLWHCQNSHYLLSSFPFMFSLLFLLLSWKHFFFFLTFLLVCHFPFHFFFYIYFCLSLFHLSALFVFIANILSFIISFFFLSFVFLPSCTHTYVHNTQIQRVDLTITQWCTSLPIKKHRIPRCVEVPNLTKWWNYLINHNYNNQALFRWCFLF